MTPKQTYIIISPVKDEELFIEKTIESVRRQTIKPLQWVIVDDGSRDGTPAILARHASEVDWITVLRLETPAQRWSGGSEIRPFLAGLGTEIRPFYAGYELVRDQKFDFIVKLDCDLAFGPDYFEQLLRRFSEDPKLGIASGAYWEKGKNGWQRIRMPGYHAAGCSKMVRNACFRDIGAFVQSQGWDTVDQIRAQMSGWKTRHFEELKLHHLKAEGSSIGFLRTSVNSGEVYYMTGGGLFFFSLKFFHRLILGRPVILGAFGMLFGLLKSRISGRSRLVNTSEANFYRALLNHRIIAAFRRSFAWIPFLGKATSVN
jgi:biofilm PGA synthesis N-glycosyltransferase PgaC